MKKTLLLLSLLVGLAITTGAQDYAIKLHYPVKTGQKYNMTVVAQTVGQNTITMQGRVVKNDREDLAIELESVVTVMEVDAIGRPTREEHAITKFSQGKADAKKAVLPAGTKVIAYKRDKKAVFEVDGKPVAEDQAKPLELAISITSGGPSDDEIFGTKERKKAGESWPINEAPALKDFAEGPMSKMFTVSKLSGRTTLQKVTKDAGTDVLHLTGTLSAKMGPAPGSPFNLVNGTMQMNLSGALPADATKGVWEEGATMNASIRASGRPNPSAPAIELTSTTRRTATTKRKLLP